MSINRTYQGRITAAHEIVDKKFTRGRELPSEEWSELLTHHLSLYQAATNYYLVCFAACSRGSEISALQNVVNKTAASWTSHEYRKSGRGKGFRNLLEEALPNMVDEATTFEEFANRLLDPNVPKETLHLAIEALLTDLGGESSIQQGGRSYLPYFCHPKTKANFPRSPELLEREKAKEELPKLLHGNSVTLNDIKSDYQVHHFATLSKGQPAIAGKGLREKLQEWISHLQKENVLSEPQAKHWKDEASELSESISIPHYNGAAAKGVEKNRLYAFICAKVLPSAPDKLAALSATFPEPKPAKKQGAPKKLTSAQQKRVEAAKREDRLRRLGADPIEEARGERGYIFPSFSSLVSRSDPADGPTWTEFDISAFKQALTALNQVDQKIVERKNELAELDEQITYFERGEGKPRNPDEPVTFAKDRRWDLAKELEQELGKTLHQDHSEAVYTLDKRTIKGWPVIRDGYRRLHKSNPGISAEELIQATIHKFQARSKNIGSVHLFELLALPEFRPLWTPVPEDQVDAWRRNEWSLDFLTDFTSYRILKDDADHLRDNLEINLTPAHLARSRRPIMLSDLGGASKVVHRDLDGQQSLVTSLYARDQETKLPSEKRFELCYSAPRLKRDALTGGENRSLMQPLMKGLGLKVPPISDVAGKPKALAVSLMPDWFTSSPRLRNNQPDRFLLNFPAKLETDWISQALGKAQLFDPKQFNGPQDDPLHLHWPDTIKLKKGEIPWWKKPEILRKGFTVASYDLGLRGAAAAVTFHVVPDTSAIPENKKPYARHIGSTPDHHWHAYPVSRKTLRLPGEDQKVYDPAKGAFMTERGGRKGRKADPRETQVLRDLIQNTFSQYLTLDADDLATPPNFLTQNFKVLRLTKFLLSYLSQCHRAFIQLKAGIALEGKKLTSLPDRIRSIIGDYNRKEACDALQRQIQEIRSHLGPLLTTAANRILPGKKYEWVIKEGAPQKLTNRNGDQEEFVPHTLQRVFGKTDRSTKIYGQGGLHARRIELIEDLRRRMASYQREVNRTIGIEPTIGYGRNSGNVPDAAPELLQKLDQLKDQRVKQTAHLVLTHSLGLRLKGNDKTAPAERPDFLHGEYEVAPKGRVADMIVIENLDRYRTDQGRARRENRQLMAWSHRAITTVLREITAPYGIPVLAVAAAYSSRFCSTTGRPGFRAVEISQRQSDNFLLRRWSTGADPQRKCFAQQVIKVLENYKGKKGFKLLVPQDGGPLFVPSFDPQEESSTRFRVVNADLNAAANLGLRAIAAPGRLDLLHKFRVKTGKSVLHPRCENIREKISFSPKEELIPISSEAIRPELLAQKFSTFFFAGEGSSAHFWTPFDLFKLDQTFLVSGTAMSKRISQLEIPCVMALNNQMLASKNITTRLSLTVTNEDSAAESLRDDDDQIPM